MAGGPAGTDLTNQLNILSQVGVVGDLSDGQLLQRYLTAPDGALQAAFTALVERHGPMVLRVCRQVLGDPHDAQDAFQATFLVLARKAGSVRKADSLASWLHGVALRCAVRAKADVSRRRVHERRGATIKAAGPEHEGMLPESWSELHEEVARLPERYREPVVMCYLEGLTTEVAALRLGCPKGTVLSRLSRARNRLRVRLTRRGLAPVPAMAWITAGLPTSVPDSLAAAATALAATGALRLTAGGSLISGAAPTSVLTLSTGVLHAMTLAKLKTAAIAISVAALLGIASAGVYAFQGRDEAVRSEPIPAQAASHAPDPKKAPDPNKALAQEQLGLARKALSDLDQLYKGGEVALYDPRFAVWERRQVEALRDSGASRAEFIAALEGYVKRLRLLQGIVEEGFRRDQVTRVDVHDAKYRVLEAEMWLNQEKAR